MALSRDLLSREGVLLLAADNVFNQALIKQFLDFERATGERLTVRVRAVGGQ